MKIITAETGKRILMTRDEWRTIGKKAGWWGDQEFADDEDFEGEEEEDFVEPEEGDYFIDINGTVTQYGKTIGKWPSDAGGATLDMLKAIEQHMQKEQFWPNVWEVSDHGNMTLLTKSDGGKWKRGLGIV